MVVRIKIIPSPKDISELSNILNNIIIEPSVELSEGL